MLNEGPVVRRSSESVKQITSRPSNWTIRHPSVHMGCQEVEFVLATHGAVGIMAPVGSGKEVVSWGRCESSSQVEVTMNRRPLAR